uniref:Ig-like domain-containing protein n=1 Tax=Globodera pallida TaxID=36090 RepID=A0A183CFE7_GLOPA
MADGFAKLLEDKEAVEGQLRVELGATLDKNSKEALIRAKWYKDGKLLNTRTSLKYKALLEMPRGEAKLIVSKLEKADSGRYKLELELTKTSAKPSTEANLFVFGKNEPRQSINMKADKAEQEKTGTSKMDEKKLKTTEKRKAPEFVKKPKQSIETINGHLCHRKETI